MQRNDIIKQLMGILKRVKNELTLDDIIALKQSIKLLENDIPKYRKEMKRWKRKYLMLSIEMKKHNISINQPNNKNQN